ncbi:unnamed protein product [Gadus morhua 'NCC']
MAASVGAAEVHRWRLARSSSLTPTPLHFCTVAIVGHYGKLSGLPVTGPGLLLLLRCSAALLLASTSPAS